MGETGDSMRLTNEKKEGVEGCVTANHKKGEKSNLRKERIRKCRSLGSTTLKHWSGVLEKKEAAITRREKKKRSSRGGPPYTYLKLIQNQHGQREGPSARENCLKINWGAKIIK